MHPSKWCQMRPWSPQNWNVVRSVMVLMWLVLIASNKLTIDLLPYICNICVLSLKDIIAIHFMHFHLIKGGHRSPKENKHYIWVCNGLVVITYRDGETNGTYINTPIVDIRTGHRGGSCRDNCHVGWIQQLLVWFGSHVASLRILSPTQHIGGVVVCLFEQIRKTMFFLDFVNLWMIKIVE